MSANLPILWNDKKNSKELEAFLAQYGPEYCFSAEEINQLRDAVNEMGVIQQSTFIGTAEPAATPTGTGNRYWTAVSPGTYTNFGGVVVNANSLAIISVTAAGVYSVSQAALNLTTYLKIVDGNKMNFWAAEPYPIGTQRNHLGKDWYLPTSAALSTDVPGTSTKWVNRLSGYIDKFSYPIDISDNITNSAFLINYSKTLLINPSKAIVKEGAVSYNINNYLTDVTIKGNLGETVDITGDILIEGYVRQSGQGGLTMKINGVVSSNINYPTLFKGDITLTFVFSTYKAYVTFSNIPSDLFSGVAYFQNTFLLDKNKFNIFVTPTAQIGEIKKNDTFVILPTFLSNGLYKYCSILTNHTYKYVTFKTSDIATTLAIFNENSSSIYPDLVSDYDRYIVINNAESIKKLRQQLDISKDISIAFGDGFYAIVQDNKVLYEMNYINTRISKYLCLASYGDILNVIDYIYIQDISVFNNKNLLSKKDLSVSSKVISNTVNTDTITSFTNDIVIPVSENKKAGKRIFESLGGEVVSGTFGLKNSILRLKVPLSDEYRIKLKFRFTENLKQNLVTKTSSLVRTNLTAQGVTVPNTAFEFNVIQNNGNVSTDFIRGINNYTRTGLDPQTKPLMSFSIRYVGIPDDGIGYTLSISSTNLILKNSSTEIVNILLSNYANQHAVLKYLIDLAIPYIEINIMHLNDAVNDWIQITNEPLITQALNSSSQVVNTAFPLVVYNTDYSWHILEIISSPNNSNTNNRFFYKKDGVIKAPLEPNYQTSYINDWIYFGGFNAVAAPIEIAEIKITKQIKQDEPKVIVLMCHTTANGLSIESGETNGYFHTSSEHIFKYKKLFDELGYSYTSIADIRDYGRFGKSISSKCWVMVFDDQQSALWDNIDMRKTFFKAGIKPVTAVIAGWIKTSEVARESLKRSSGHGWEYVSHSWSHTLGTLTYEEILIQNQSLQDYFYWVFEKEVDIIVYPNGTYNTKVIETMISLGYNLGLTTDGTLIAPKETFPLKVTRLDGSESNTFAYLESIIRKNDEL